MKHVHSTCPAEPGCVISAFLLLFALIVVLCSDNRLDYVMIPGRGRVDCK